MLSSLHIFAGKSDVDLNEIISSIIVNLRVHVNIINDLVWQTKQGTANGSGHTQRIVRIDHNWSSGEGLIELGFESQSKGLVIQVSNIGSVDLEHDGLNVIFSRSGQVVAFIHNIIAIWAHALGAIDISPFWITHTAACFLIVPTIVSEGGRELIELLVTEINSTAP